MDLQRRHLLLAALGAPFVLRTRGLGAAPHCPRTETNLLGPAYRSGAPLRNVLCEASEPGTPLRMAGTVTAAESCDRLGAAILDVWQVDNAGDYDMSSPAFRMRGRVQADRNGWYRFDTVVPAAYGARARHIHYLVTAPGYEPHITQSYFDGDERLAHDGLVKPPLVVRLRRTGGRMLGKFDVVMQKEKPADAAAMAAWPDFVGKYQVDPHATLAVTLADGKLQWRLSAPENPGDPLTGVFYPRAANRFFCAEYDLTATFVRENGRVTHLLINDQRPAKKLA